MPSLTKGNQQDDAVSHLTIGDLHVWPPVVLAPMAGITNAAFRTLCRRFGAGLYVSEMATARGIVEDWPRSREIAHFAPDEYPKSIQLYATDPHWTGLAAVSYTHLTLPTIYSV